MKRVFKMSKRAFSEANKISFFKGESLTLITYF